MNYCDKCQKTTARKGETCGTCGHFYYCPDCGRSLSLVGSRLVCPDYCGG